MEEAQKMKILEGAQKAFFEAMLDGYAGGDNRKSAKVKGEDGYTTITYTSKDGECKVVDRYCTTPLSDKSCGTTTIFYENGSVWVPVWWMSYGGRYPKRVIPFLKESLKWAYEMRDFCGGRGISSTSR